MFKKLKQIYRLKAVLNGDIVPEQGECPGFVLPEEVDHKDVTKKLLRYYYTTEQGVPTGKAETSTDIPEMQHEYVLPIRMKIGEVLVACRNQMRAEIRKKEKEVLMTVLLAAAAIGIAFFLFKTFRPH